MNETGSGRTPGVPYTQKSPEIAALVDSFHIDYDRAAVAVNPVAASIALVTEAINIMADSFPSHSISPDRMKLIQSRLRMDGNYYNDEDVRKYVMTDDALVTLIHALNHQLMYVLDFSGKDESKDENLSDKDIKIDEQKTMVPLLNAIIGVHDAGVSAGGTFATTMGAAIHFAMLHGVNKATIIFRLSQMIRSVAADGL